jgi:hypothetical protein
MRVIPERVTAEIEGDFVVFLIGMRINKPWRPDKWLPAFLAMPRMLKELAGRPDSGYLGHVQSLAARVDAGPIFNNLGRAAAELDPADQRIAKLNGKWGISRDARGAVRAIR